MYLIVPLLALMAAPATAQRVALDEDFSGPRFPPAGWQKTTVGSTAGWKDGAGSPYGGAGMAFHDDYFQSADSHLITPPLDLTGWTSAYLHFVQGVRYRGLVEHHYVQVTTDDGITITTLTDLKSPAEGMEQPIRLNLSDFAGQDNVRISFHYTGTYATEWYIDDVRVTDAALEIVHSAYNPATDHVYHLFEPSSWMDAETLAIKMGGHLVSIADQAENDWLALNVGAWDGKLRDLWLGLYDFVEGAYYWSDGEPFVYSNWNTGEPNNATGHDSKNGEDYVVMYGLPLTRNGYWNDTTGRGLPDNRLAQGVAEFQAPHLVVNGLRSGGTCEMSAFGVHDAVWFCWSVRGAGPTTTPFGFDLDLSMPIEHHGPVLPNASHTASWSTGIPFGTEGLSLWLQAVEKTVAGFAVTNSVHAAL